MPVGQGYIFILLLALTVGTVALVLMQVLFGLLEVKKRKLQERLGGAPESAFVEAAPSYGSITLDSRPPIPAMLAQSPAMRLFHARLARAFPGVDIKRFMFMILTFAAVTAVVVGFGTGSYSAAMVCAIIAGILPFMIVSSRCARHQKVVEDQLPEALDFLARVLRAGHSLATGMQIAGDEIPEPLAGEFRRCYGQHSLGTSLDAAMKEMAQRVGTPDFSFFVTAVLIQRTTGGDLAEVLSNISTMVRARIRLQQHVKAITAQGRLVGYILLVLPVVFFLALYAINPKYASVLIDTQNHPEGVTVLGVAVFLQMLGLFTIKKIVTVRM
jgi:tight adherence protein B